MHKLQAAHRGLFFVCPKYSLPSPSMHGIVSLWRNYALPGVVAGRLRQSQFVFILLVGQFSGVPI